jgi:hypothetical protein
LVDSSSKFFSTVFDAISVPSEVSVNRLNLRTLTTGGERLIWETSNSKAISTEWTNLGKTYSINTILTPLKLSGELQEALQELNNIQVASRQIVNNILKFTFYITEAQSKIVGTYLPMCETVSATITSTQYAGTYTALQRIVPTITQVEQGIDLYLCEIDMIIENIIHNNYN